VLTSSSLDRCSTAALSDEKSEASIWLMLQGLLARRRPPASATVCPKPTRRYRLPVQYRTRCPQAAPESVREVVAERSAATERVREAVPAWPWLDVYHQLSARDWVTGTRPAVYP
jgi:hypothetical protein